ncbi:hypothetical protein NEMIN01_2378 [Nematocida minor]|uniref:uncharacterized protein n=1 Tax=Nematocida minor TaxID=1912983 RepID=UPI002220FFD1|nr:uncharacterized protein NEMIN01_2378 [Nematocida minor]KAI5193040.1 hypothetical protein NEMIN01_2378 [Nematocida minor]
MKNRKLTKMLAGAGLALFLAQCRGSSAAYNWQDSSVIGLSRSESDESSDIEYLGHVYTVPSTSGNSSAHNESCAGTTRRAVQKPDESGQCKERPSVIKHTSEYSMKADRLSIGEKRKEREINSPVSPPSHEVMPANKRQKTDDAPKEDDIEQLSEDAIETLSENEEQQPVQRYQTTQRVVERRSGKNIDRLNINLWNDMELRLGNRRRKCHKENHKTVYTRDNLNGYKKWRIQTRSYKTSLGKSIEDFVTKIVPLIKLNPMWYFIASKSTYINTKYRDLLGVQELLKNEESPHTKMVKSIEGYRPNIIDDMIAYIEKYQPLRVKKDEYRNTWEETLGDFYIRKYYALNYSMLEGLNVVNQLEKKYHPLVHAVHMILALPEVHQDFSNISESLIKETDLSDKPSVNKSYQEVLLRMQRVLHLRTEEKTDHRLYVSIYSYLERPCGGERSLDGLVAVDLYRYLYAVLAKFYEKAEVISAEKEYVLSGKCVIKNQKYIKFEKVVSIAQDRPDTKPPVPTYSLEMNRWSISPFVHAHYHVYYVDNATHQIRTLCMPMYVDKHGKEHYVHTIDEVVKYIKVLYGANEESNHTHAFKVRKDTKEWSYVKKKDRKKTIKDLAGHEVVFYRIAEDLAKTRFTFAEFKPLYPHGQDRICIPLFLTPMMQSAAELGPFKKKGEHTETDSMRFENRVTDKYKYNGNYRGSEFSDLHMYYSNFYIVPDKERKKSADCYVMDCRTAAREDGTVKAVWYVRMPVGVDEYMHCVLDSAFKEKENAEKFNSFVEALESREHKKDSELQGIWLRNENAAGSGHDSQARKMHIWQIGLGRSRWNPLKYKVKIEANIRKSEEMLEKAEKAIVDLKTLDKCSERPKMRSELKTEYITQCRAKRNLELLHREMCEAVSERPEQQTDFIVFRNVNESKSNLGTHNEVLDVLISLYNRKVLPQRNK